MTPTPSCHGRLAARGWALALVLAGAAAAPAPSEGGCLSCGASSSGGGGEGGAKSSCPALVQKRSVVRHKVQTASRYEEEGSDCAQRLGNSGTHPAACVVVQGDKALLVKVPYGSIPGWDLPGGYHHPGEAACETAEREVCEETGYSVRAVARLGGAVFRCEVTGSNVCTKPVDEGFLPKQWFGAGELGGLKFRGGTWGDKLGLLKQELR
uniref:Nudix hydrolase domain-containing protein n=1 Tax=Alexandrium catenella TaxID=2925 RepID=A0A7S1MJF6_ALECA|mmetsp:Transcript_28102/g.76094  ORF Transcript_28102/g.76094 Transcript_28102/m.76094 type:complete len:210 (+) Transcript_28102:89-718(+)|eukprot:CAMPEP_0171174374 /NCGR_PEP_ID=MMETSP0790-20130122/10694_1 /TAXON_ID=2925 /ORGANISM="Alexandrium catenella, Strain OF101" /LENGTH=209 /DNA_ID=CAMNT_0011639245 /DNA_START=45 /DNA_END=674 /DNA_ORIENTATION=+